jgi:hypothetical protein
MHTSLGLGWKLAQEATFGEFDLYNYLASSGLAPFAALAAAEGWGAGKMNLYTLGGGEQMQVLLHIALLWDSPADFGQFELAFDTALDRLDYESRGDDDGVWRWDSPGEHGRAVWTEDGDRVDLLFGTDEAIVARAIDRLSTP